ncbi:phosphatidate cytidylyltransferase, mitochondrial-like [Haliotis asinina]|uniref:phosphatidate cytidylyltransferase, mitochondrial-like n=1 Tax=Haliotis asinina TaxID=109174 RepID=UPI003531A1A3
MFLRLKMGLMSQFIVKRMCSSLVEKSLVSSLYQRVLSTFPDGMQMALAYGSGVYQQEGHVDMSKNMLDFIFVVDDPLSWHRQNIRMNPKHYSFLKFFGPKHVTRVQDKFSAGIYFNTLVPFEERVIKYGVISTDRLITDLLDWDTLYVSGRLHKPVKLLILPKNASLLSAMQINLQSAVHAALLMLPEFFSEEDLYIAITGLSYNGDFRMTVGEDKKKIMNIVKPNIEYFRRLYETILDHEEHIYWHKSKGNFEQYPNYISQYHHLSLLPKNVQTHLVEMRSHGGSSPDLEEVLRVFAHDRNCDEHVAKIIANIVWWSSVFQSVKSVFTAGVMKSFRYSGKKLRKMFKSQSK